jgi:hypothetical protein
MFTRERDRHLHLVSAMMHRAVDTLRQGAHKDGGIPGVVLVTENQKLMRKSGQRLLASLGWHMEGKDSRGLDVWTVEFRQNETDLPTE